MVEEEVEQFKSVMRSDMLTERGNERRAGIPMSRAAYQSIFVQPLTNTFLGILSFNTL
jgi:hypothetical protein